jgi:hypothetical protein
MKIRRILEQVVVLGALGLLFGSLPCRAAPSSLWNGGYYIGSESFDIISPVANGNFGAGGFYGTWDPGGGPVLPFYFWCIQLDQYFSPGTTYTDEYVAIDEGTNNKFSALFTLVGGSLAALSSTERSAAFQLAVWDIQYDGGDGLGVGAFRVTGGDAAAINDANTWLSALGTSGTFDVIKFYSRERQDFIGDRGPPQLAPEPSTLPLLLLGSSALALALRRRGARPARVKNGTDQRFSEGRGRSSR